MMFIQSFKKSILQKSHNEADKITQYNKSVLIQFDSHVLSFILIFHPKHIQNDPFQFRQFFKHLLKSQRFFLLILVCYSGPQ
jgi:hypothetical protein